MFESFTKTLANIKDYKSYIKAKSFIKYNQHSAFAQISIAEIILALDFKEVLGSAIANRDTYAKLFNAIAEKTKNIGEEQKSLLFDDTFTLIYTQCIVSAPKTQEKEMIEFLYRESISCIAKICDYTGLNKNHILSTIASTLILSILKTFLQAGRQEMLTDKSVEKPISDNDFFDLSQTKKPFNPQKLIQTIMPSLEGHGVTYEDIDRELNRLRVKLETEHLKSVDTTNALNISYLSIFCVEEVFSDIFPGQSNLEGLFNTLKDNALFYKEKKLLNEGLPVNNWKDKNIDNGIDEPSAKIRFKI